MEQVDTTTRLQQLRELMKTHKVDIYGKTEASCLHSSANRLFNLVVPSEDAHNSEFLASTDARREFISGFTGSAGKALITHNKAALSTDGRYFNQASKQLDGNWELLKQGMKDVPTWMDWVADRASEDGGGKIVGVDPTTLASTLAKKLSEKIKKKGGKDLVAITENLIDVVWGKDKPSRPSEPVKALGAEYSGKEFHEKIKELRSELDKKQAKGFVVSMLDEVAWLFNLRGNDIPYNPVFFSYAVITPTTATLYVEESKLEGNAKSYLAGVNIRPYDEIFADIAALAKEEPVTNGDGQSSTAPKRKFLISTNASWAVQQALGGEENVEELRSPIGDAKAIKNETEMEGMRQCHIRDGAALTEYFAWLEHTLIIQGKTVDEIAGADKLEEIRKKQAKFVGLSFETISSSGPNAAIIHYSPERGNCAIIDPAKIYLCDSGAQYLDGTTDTTRTLHFGEPTAMERASYTLVLKGHIALELAVFPKGTTGFALDALARQHLWTNGLDYRHGTGHGVGSFLNVHEGPIGIGTRIQCAEVPLAVGNVISNEPGYYEDGSFGIRIENVVMVKEVQTKHKFGDKPFLGFEHVTMVPMCRKLIDVGMLSERERNWLNAYHREVLEKTSAFFKEDKISREWLERECAPY